MFVDVDEPSDIELMGYKDDLQEVHRKLDSLLSRVGNIEKTESPASGYSPQKHGNFAQWGSVIVSLLALVITGFSVNSFRGKLEKLTGDVTYIKGRLGIQEALTRFIDPNTVTRGITATVENATKAGQVLPQQELVSYKEAIRGLPETAQDRWTALASLVNYQSLLNQKLGGAPNPETVSGRCGISHAIFSNDFFRNCTVDLDGNVFKDTTFINSVVRYHGGKTSLSNVKFVNCWFDLDLPQGTKPEQEKFLFALLDSPDQKKITVN